tara:strand:+ start:195 stop:1322 length:1128 start_codon:yes stop_codon:yes gene_type:complete
MILDRMRLLNILDTLKMASGHKVMKISDFVKFTVDKSGGAVYMGATNFETFMIVDYGDVSLCQIEDMPDVFLIEFGRLLNLIKASTTTDAKFSCNAEGDVIKVATNGSFKFPVFKEHDQYPTSDYANNEAGTWQAEELNAIFEKVKIAISKDVTKLSYQGINYDGNWAACDNRRLSVVRGGDNHQYDGKSVLVPATIGELFSRCKGEVKIGVNDDGNMVVITNEGSGLLAAMRLIESPFVPYQRLFDDAKEHIIAKLPKVEILGALKRLGCFTDKIFKVGKLEITTTPTGAQFKCSIENDVGDGAEVIDAMEFEIVGDQSQLEGFSASYLYQIENLSEGIEAVDSQTEVVLHIQPDGKLRINEDKFSYLLSPIVA